MFLFGLATCFVSLWRGGVGFRLCAPAVEQNQAVGCRLQAQLQGHSGLVFAGQPLRAGLERRRGRLQV